MPKKFLIFIILILSFTPSFAASIIKDTQSDFTQVGASFECTNATAAAGSVILDFYGGDGIWTTDGVTVCAETNNQESPQIIPDGAGGAIIAWEDNRTTATTGTDVYAQRINADGSIHSSWPSGGLAICTEESIQLSVQIISDEAGGAIIVWQDYRDSVTTGYDIYAQRIDADGSVHPGWPAGGAAISAASGDQKFPGVVLDGNNGAIIAWEDSRNGNRDIFAQRINIATGATLWVSDVAVCAEVTNSVQQMLRLVADGAGGAIIAWQDLRNGNVDIYAQRIEGAGSNVWTPLHGVPVCVATGSQLYPQIISDGNNGAIICWYDLRGTSWDIYAQRLVGSDGSPDWTANGVAVSTAESNQENPKMIPDGAGGAIIAWEDDRGGGVSDYDIYAQRVNSIGDVLWSADVAVCTASLGQHSPVLVSDGAGGAIIAWSDYRNGAGSYDIYAQHLNSSGGILWESDGAPVCLAPDWQEESQIASDGAGGAIIVWNDYRINGAEYDIFAQRINEVYYPFGTYTTEKIENTDSSFIAWDTLNWTSLGSGITAEVKTASSSAGLDTAAWTSISGSGNIPDPTNPWIQARFYFIPFNLGLNSPQLEDIAFEYLNETTPPTISNVKIDGSTAVSGMQISPTPSIEATITDADSGVNGFTIRVFIDGTPYPTDTYLNDVITYQHPATLSASSLHTIKIHAADNQENWATWEAANLQVVEPVIPPTVTGSYSVPNPFNPEIESVTIYFYLPQTGDFNLLIFKPNSELIYKKLFVGQSAGAKNIAWNGRNDSGQIVDNGVYLYRIISGSSIVSSGNIIVIK